MSDRVPLLEPDLVAEIVERTARRVVELLEERDRKPPSGLVDARTLAALLSIPRSTVYEYADELGAVTIGRGKCARIRFDLETARRAWTPRHASSSSTDEIPPAVGAPRRRRRSAARGDPRLLPIGSKTHNAPKGGLKR